MVQMHFDMQKIIDNLKPGEYTFNRELRRYGKHWGHKWYVRTRDGRLLHGVSSTVDGAKEACRIATGR